MKQKKSFRIALCVFLGAMILCTGTMILVKTATSDEFQSGTVETINISEIGLTPESERQEKYDRYLEQVLADDLASYYDFSEVNLDLTYNESEDIYTAVVTIVRKDNQEVFGDDETSIKNAIAKALEKISTDDITILIVNEDSV
ncbi:MAG: hypothetical protein J6K48_14410 [Lachnospiraceae bacterium]|nr:hypothetical protein [Lachnospiraceae bacterium]